MAKSFQQQMTELASRVAHIPDAIELPPKEKFEKYLPYNLAKQFDKLLKQESPKPPKRGKLR